jgi:hypothetical protein
MDNAEFTQTLKNESGFFPIFFCRKQKKRIRFFCWCKPGVDVMIAIFCGFRQFSAKNWRFSQFFFAKISFVLRQNANNFAIFLKKIF